MNKIEKIINESNVLIKKEKRTYNFVSFFRVVFFILFIIETLRGFSKLINYEIFFGLTSFGLFILLLFKSNIVTKKIEFFENIKKTCQEINEQGLNDTLDLHYNSDISHSYCSDLDIFGKNSLFRKINRSQTIFGDECLKNYLQNPLLSTKKIYHRQDAIKELSSKIEWCVNFLASTKTTDSKNLNKKNISYLFSSFNNKKLDTEAIKMLLIVIPIFNIIFPFLVFIFKINLLSILFPFIVSGIIIKIYSNSIREIYTSVNFKSSELKKYISALTLIEQESFSSTELSFIKKKLILQNGTKSSDFINTLSKLIDLFENRNVIFYGTLINVFFLWELRYAYKIEKYLNNNVSQIPNFIDTIGEFEALICLGLFAYQNEDFNYPFPSGESRIIDIKKFAHPFVDKEKRVFNDFFINKDNRVTIITGANMTGKSTFLRSIGINMILAMNGCPICAESFSFYPISVFTSMKTSDSLSDGSSYFNAEIKRLKLLVEKLENKEPQLIILDEILKGTNSIDKLKGSKLFLEKIMNVNTFNTCLIATHDLGLTEIENKYPLNISNYCFELHNNNGTLEPDYKLQKGVTKSMNAIQLMKINNIID